MSGLAKAILAAIEYKFTPEQEQVIKDFIANTLDKRIEIALKHEAFQKIPNEVKHIRIRHWMQYYGKEALKLLYKSNELGSLSGPAFDTAYRTIMRLIKENSKYYDRY